MQQDTCRYVFSGSIGSVRLRGGIVPQQGFVEICLNGLWSRVCYSTWNHRDAVVVCAQLQYPASKISKKYIMCLYQQ